MDKFLQCIYGGEKRVGLAKGDKSIRLLSYQDMMGCISMGFEPGEIDEEVGLDEIQFLPPVDPAKIMCLGWNYAEHIDEMKGKKPDHPMLFYKPTSALIGHLDDVVLPSDDVTKEVHNEVELAIVIGKEAKRVNAKEAFNVVAGYTIIQDITARDLQSEAKKKNEQWEIAKSFDTFAPMGPWIVPSNQIKDPQNLNLSLRVNGKIRQDSNTKHMVFKIPEIIEYLSQAMTLHPGDIIATGTPKGVDKINEGDILEAEIEEIGILKNTVVRE
ncbi:MAG: fumarylacetoacetate hydrolase family protein [Candidatus Altiarchaeota archaeon]